MGWKCENPKCTAVLPDSAQFCRRCGRRKPAMAPMKADAGNAAAIFAGTGFPVEAQTAGSLYEPLPPQRPPVLLWSILAAILFLVLMALAMM